MNFLWNFAHGDESHTETASSISTGLQNPAIAWTLVILLAFALMLGSLWLLKKFTPWQFPTRKVGK